MGGAAGFGAARGGDTDRAQQDSRGRRREALKDICPLLKHTHTQTSAPAVTKKPPSLSHSTRLLLHVAMETQEAESRVATGPTEDGGEEHTEELCSLAARDEDDEFVVLRKLNDLIISQSQSQPIR